MQQDKSRKYSLESKQCPNMSMINEAASHWPANDNGTTMTRTIGLGLGWVKGRESTANFRFPQLYP